MTQKERELAAYMLDSAADVFGNHTCNDVDDEAYESWSLEERQALVRAYYEYNGEDPDDYDETDLNLPDWAIMRMMAEKLRNNE